MIKTVPTRVSEIDFPGGRPEGNRCRSLATFAIALVASVIVSKNPTAVLAVEFIEIIEKQIAEKIENQHGFRIENFDQWVFSNQDTIDGAERQLLERLRGEAESIQSTCRLADEQKEKLLLAGRGDIHSFRQLYAETRAKFAENMDDQQAMQNIWQEIQPLQLKYHGRIYGEGSLFTKVLDHLLDEQQSALMVVVRREQRRFQYRAAVMQLVSQLDQGAPFTHEKREKLIALIHQNTFPPKSIGGGPHNQYLTVYLFSQLAEIPEHELRPLFGKAGWKMMQRQMRQGKSMKRHLETLDLVPEKD